MVAQNAPSRVASGIPSRSGVSLKPAHYRVILEDMPDVGFFEVHAENYMGSGGLPHRYLEAVRAHYPISLHGVGASIAGARPLDPEHVARLKALVSRYEPGLVSEHLAWSMHELGYLNDLLPLPYAEETLQQVCDNVDQLQMAIGRPILLENPSTYVLFAESTIPEPEFLATVAKRTGCGLLLDVSNVYVSATNHGYDPFAYIDSFPIEHVGEIHLGGFAECNDGAGDRLLIDAHGAPVDRAVWPLYAHALAHIGPVATLIEWDNDVPAWPVLFREAERADNLLRKCAQRHNRAGVSRGTLAV